MIQELLYTSAPKGLKPGSRGFCTVLSTSGMSAPVATTLESLSGYRPVFPPDDPRAHQNPIVYSHLLMSLSGRRSHVLSRIADYGLDYSQRTNKLAHHVVIETSERPSAGPAWTLAHSGTMRESWDGELKIVPGERRIPDEKLTPKVCAAWKEVTGDAGWAGVLAEAFLNHPDRPAFMIFSPGMNLLPLIEEAIALLPTERRWDVTFSTYFTKLPSGVTCNWRCLLADSPEANESRRYVQSLRIDLTQPLAPAKGGALVETARTGRLPVRLEPESLSRQAGNTGGLAAEAAVPSAPPLPPPPQNASAGNARRRKRISDIPVGYGEEQPTSSGSALKWTLALVALGLIGTGAAVVLQSNDRPGNTLTANTIKNKPTPPAPAASPPSPEPVPTAQPAMTGTPAAPPVEPKGIEVTAKLSPLQVAENASINEAIGQFTFERTPSSGTKIDLAVIGDDFKVEEKNGAYHLYATRPFDYEDPELAEKKHAVPFTIKISGEGIAEKTQPFTIEVTDVPEKPTKIELSEKIIPYSAPAGTTVGTLTTIGQDSGDKAPGAFNYHITKGNKQFKLVENEGTPTLVTNIDFKPANSTAAVTIRSEKKNHPELFIEQEFTIEAYQPKVTQHYWVPTRENLFFRESKFPLPKDIPLDIQTVKVWTPTNSKDFLATGGSVSMRDTTSSDYNEDTLIAAILESERSLSLKSNRQVGRSQLGQLILSLESPNMDRHDILLFDKVARTPNDTLHIPLTWPQTPNLWNLKLNILTIGDKKNNLAKTFTKKEKTNEAEGISFSYSDGRLSCTTSVDVFSIIERATPPAPLTDRSTDLSMIPIKIEVRVQPLSTRGESKETEVKVIIGQGDFEKKLTAHAETHFAPPLIPLIPNGNLLPSSSAITDPEILKNVESFLNDVEKFIQSKTAEKDAIKNSDPNADTKRTQIGQSITDGETQKKHLKALVSFIKYTQSVCNDVKQCGLQELQISQKCRNGDEEKYIPIIVYRKSDSQDHPTGDK